MCGFTMIWLNTTELLLCTCINFFVRHQQNVSKVGPVADNLRASQPVARCVMVKISVAVRRRFIATASFCQSVGLGLALDIPPLHTWAPAEIFQRVGGAKRRLIATEIHTPNRVAVAMNRAV